MLKRPHFRPNPDVIAQRMGAEIVLIHLRTDRIYELNRTAARVWGLLGAGHDQAQIQQQLLDEFNIGETQLAGEIVALLDLMQAEGLLVTREHG